MADSDSESIYSIQSILLGPVETLPFEPTVPSRGNLAGPSSSRAPAYPPPPLTQAPVLPSNRPLPPPPHSRRSSLPAVHYEGVCSERQAQQTQAHQQKVQQQKVRSRSKYTNSYLSDQSQREMIHRRGPGFGTYQYFRGRFEDVYGRICKAQCKISRGCVAMLSMCAVVLSLLSFGILALVVTGYVQLGCDVFRTPICVHIGSSEFNPRGIALKKEHGQQNTYCARTSSEMSALLSEILKFKQRRMDALTDAAKDPTHPRTNTVPHAHVALKRDPYPAPTPHRLHMNDLNSIRADSQRQRLNGVEHKDRGIQIEQSALYYVYSSIDFNPSTCKTPIPIDQSVFSKSPSSPKVELTKTKFTTCCSSCYPHLIKQTNFAGGVFYLERDSLIYVEVSDVEQIDFYPTSSYFGLFFLGLDLTDDL